MGKKTPLDYQTFAINLLGMLSDHAVDQKLLAELLEEWKHACETEMCGERALLALTPSELLPFLMAETQRDVKEVGSTAKWLALSDEEKQRRLSKVYHCVAIAYEECELEALSAEEQWSVDLFL